FPKRLARVIGWCPSAWMTAGGKTLPILGGQLGIQQLPLGWEHAAQDGVTGCVGGGFGIVEGVVGLERRGIRRGQIEGGKLGQLVAGRIGHAANQHPDMAHCSSVVQADAPSYHTWRWCRVGTCPGGYSRLPFWCTTRRPEPAQHPLGRDRRGSPAPFWHAVRL